MIPLLRLTGLSKSFGGVQALANVSFALRPGEVHALVGENGAGKSTLVKLVTGAHQPDEGTIEFAGSRVGPLDPQRARKLGIAVIYQQPTLFPELTVAENVSFGVEPPGFWRRIRWDERRQRATRLLEAIGAGISPDAEAGRLSMPEQQLVEIARALSTNARMLILDEPTASLSEEETQRLFDVIRRLKGEGVGILYISHRLDELPQIADRVTILRDGRLIETSPLAEISASEMIRKMVGRELHAVFPQRATHPGEVLLETRRLACRAGAIHNVNLSVRAGEIVGLAGLVGAGRTEVARVLFGLTPADEGEILLRGDSTAIASPSAAAALGIAYVPEDRRRHGVVSELSVAANTSLATLAAISRRGLIDFAAERRLAADSVDRLGVKTPSVHTLVENLSGGNQQKVALARWLAANPRLLILDEPTQGVDIGAKAEIHRLMNDLAQRGMAILMISSDLPEILGMSDRIVVMRGGTTVGEVDRAEATQERLLAKALGHRATAKGAP